MIVTGGQLDGRLVFSGNLPGACLHLENKNTTTTTICNRVTTDSCDAHHIGYGDVKYDEVLVTAGIPSLHDRREKLTSNFFRSIRQPSSCLHHLMPVRRMTETVSRLRTAVEYAIPFCRTKRFQTSFLPYSLKNFNEITPIHSFLFLYSN